MKSVFFKGFQFSKRFILKMTFPCTNAVHIPSVDGIKFKPLKKLKRAKILREEEKTHLLKGFLRYRVFTFVFIFYILKRYLSFRYKIGISPNLILDSYRSNRQR